MACLFNHRWVPVAIYNYWDTSYGGRVPDSQVTMRCEKCGALKSKQLRYSGHPSLEELRGNGERIGDVVVTRNEAGMIVAVTRQDQDGRILNVIATAENAGMQDAEKVCAQAYQVVGSLLSDVGAFNTDHARRILDNLSQARIVHDDVLPWPSFSKGGEHE